MSTVGMDKFREATEISSETNETFELHPN